MTKESGAQRIRYRLGQRSKKTSLLCPFYKNLQRKNLRCPRCWKSMMPATNIEIPPFHHSDHEDCSRDSDRVVHPKRYSQLRQGYDKKRSRQTSWPGRANQVDSKQGMPCFWHMLQCNIYFGSCFMDVLWVHGR